MNATQGGGSGVDVSSRLFDKTYGALAGGAVGDAMGQVTETMLYPTIERVHIYSANFGRDADTIGSIVGGIVGAHEGIGGLPPAWVDRVNAVNDVRQDDLARRLLPCITAEIERARQRLRLLELLQGAAPSPPPLDVGTDAPGARPA